MSVGVTRYDPFVVLADLIKAEVPELADDGATVRVTVDHADPSRIQVWPSLTILPGRFKANWSQAERVAWHEDGAKVDRPKHHHPDDDPSRVIVSVGHWTGVVTLRLGATSAAKRRNLEQAIANVWAAEHGVLRAEVPACANAVHEWVFDDEGWRDELAFDRILFSELELSATHPILVELTGITAISDLQIHFTEDLASAWGDIPTGDIEKVTVNDDGSITPVP